MTDKNLLPFVQCYETGNNSGLPSDHLPVFCTISFPQEEFEQRSLQIKNRFLVKKSLHVSPNKISQQHFKTVLETKLTPAYRAIETLHPQQITQSQLDRVYKETSDIIYNAAAVTMKRKKSKTNKISTQTLSKKYKTLRSFCFHIQRFLATLKIPDVPSESKFLCFLTKKQKKSLKTLASVGIGICPIHTVEAWLHWIATIKNKCLDIKQQIRCVLYKNKSSQSQQRNQLLQNDRKRFYKNFVFSKSATQGTTATIWNDITKSNTTNPSELKQTLVREASKILQSPTLPPPNPPAWFVNGYKWNAKGVHKSIWDPLIAPFTPDEILSALNGPPKAPGFDGVTNEVLKLACKSDPKCPNLVLKHITKISNLWYSTGICPKLCSIGKMQLIPKTGKKDPTKYTSQRPLTLQPEEAKVPLRILANRLQNILHERKLLHPAQHAYIVGGSVDQCLNLLLNHMEDSMSKNKTLFLLLHDMHKAFDLTQWWVLKLTLDRFAIPKKFQTFLLNYLQKSQTFIQTKYGPTDLISLKNSVKQGDPLSGYLYIMTLDLMHELCHNQNHFTIPKLGFQWNDTQTCSMGYADDVSTTSDTLGGTHELTKFVGEYAKFHTTSLNPKKSDILIVNPTTEIEQEYKQNPIQIQDVVLTAVPKNEPKRFLGLQIRADLSPESQIKKMKKQMYNILSKLWSKSLNFQEALFVYQDILISTLNFTSKFVHIPNQTLKEIDRDVFSSLSNLDQNPFHGPHKLGFFCSINILPMKTHNKIISIAESYVTLTDCTPEGATTRQRAEELKNKKSILTTPSYKKNNRLARCVIYARTLGLHFHDNSHIFSQLHNKPRCIKMIMTPNEQAQNKLPRLSWSPKEQLVFCSYQTHPHSEISTWVIRGTYPKEFLKTGTYKSNDPVLLKLIAIVYTLEHVNQFCSVKIFVSDDNILGTISKYKFLTHRQKLKLTNSFFYRRINFLQTMSNYTNTLVASHQQNVSMQTLVHPLPAPPHSSTVIQWEVGAPIYYLEDCKTQQIVTTYPRTYLSLLCKLRRFEQWGSETGHQSKHIRDYPHLKDFIFRVPFNLRTFPHFSAIMCNRLPSMRLLHHVPPFSDFKIRKNICLLCHIGTHNPRHNRHFFICPQAHQITQRYIKTSDAKIKSGDIRPFTPNHFTNPYGTLQKYLATHLFQKIPFTNSDLTAILNNTPKICTRGNKTKEKLLEDAVTLINGLNPATNILIFLDGSSFPVTHDCATHTAGSSAIVFFPGENYSIETSAFLGNRDSSYAELYSVHLALEVIHNQMRVCKFPSHVQVHFITDSKDVKRMISTNSPPTRHTALVQFLRREVAQTLKPLKPHFHWVASHIGLSPHDRADTLAKSAALSMGTPPAFPPGFCHKHYQKGMRLELPSGLACQNDLSMDEEIYSPDLSGNTSLLIAKFFTNYLINNPGHTPTIEDGWFSAFLNMTYTPPPPWRDNDLLVTALRTPYVVTKHPHFTPLNALGWSCYRYNPTRPEFGFFSKNTPCSQLYLYALTEREIKTLNGRIRANFQNNQGDPWRVVFITTEKENKFLRKFKNTFYTTVACFVHDDRKYFLHLIENRLSQIVDPILFKKLKSWISQFSDHKLFVAPESSKVSRRSIQSYFHAQLPENSPTLTQPYMSYLNPPVNSRELPLDPSLSLVGFHPSYHYHKSELSHTHQFIRELYNKVCHKYEIIKTNLKKK